MDARIREVAAELLLLDSKALLACCWALLSRLLLHWCCWHCWLLLWPLLPSVSL